MGAQAASLQKLLTQMPMAWVPVDATMPQVPAQAEEAAISDAEKVRLPVDSMHVPVHACMHAAGLRIITRPCI